MTEVQILAAFLKETRKKLGESQMEFAANSGISVECLSHLERGLSDPTMGTLQSIAAYTGCTVADMLTPPDVQG